MNQSKIDTIIDTFITNNMVNETDDEIKDAKEKLAYLANEFYNAFKEESNKIETHKITVDLSHADLEDLLDDENTSFDWTFTSDKGLAIDVHVVQTQYDEDGNITNR